MELVCKTLGDCFRNREHWWLPREMFSGTTFILNGCKEKKIGKSMLCFGVFEKKKKSILVAQTLGWDLLSC